MITSALKDELAWALDATRNPPNNARQVTREYVRLHALLRDLDNALRGWVPLPGATEKR